MRSAMANSQNMPAMSSATPTAADPMSLTCPIFGSWSVVSRSASFSIAVLSSSTTSTSTTTATSSTRRMVVAPISHASGTETARIASSSRTACSERIAKARPLRVLMVARHSRSKLQARRGRHRRGLGCALLLQKFGDQESHVDRLLGIEAGIADGVVAIAEILMGDGAGAADAFGDILPGHLEMNAAGMGALRSVNAEERLDLRQDAVERPGLVAGVGADGVAVHWIARPHHCPALALDGADHRRQEIADLLGAKPRDQRQPARLVVGIEHVDQFKQFVRLQRRPAFQPDRVLDAAKVFDMGVVELPGAVADPDHVARGRVPVPGSRVDAGKSLLVAEQQRLMAGVEIGGAQLGMALEIEAAGAHEIQRIRDAVSQLLVAPRLLGILQEAEHPLVHTAEIGQAAGGERAQQIERRGRLPVRHQLTLRIGRARLFREPDIVDDVAAVARQLDAVDRLDRR